MKKALKRIQETLDQLETIKQPAAEPSTVTDRRPVSFQISPVAPKVDLPPPPAPKGDRLPQLPQIPVSGVEPSSVAESELEPSPSANISDRVVRKYHIVKNTAKSLFPNSAAPGEIELDSSPGQTELALEQVVEKIQALYYEGPIVNGWIDYYPAALESDEEVEEIVFERPDFSTTASKTPDPPSSSTSYRVCGVDESGQPWSYSCPIDQLLELSVAIARYRKLQELLVQKKQLEAQLKS